MKILLREKRSEWNERFRRPSPYPSLSRTRNIYNKV